MRKNNVKHLVTELGLQSILVNQVFIFLHSPLSVNNSHYNSSFLSFFLCYGKNSHIRNGHLDKILYGITGSHYNIVSSTVLKTINLYLVYNY